MAGDVSDFTAKVTKDLATKVASTIGVNSSSVKVTITPASVNINFEIGAATQAAATAMLDTMKAKISDASKATSFFAGVQGVAIQVESVGEIGVASVGGAKNVLPTASALGGGGAAAALLVLVVVCLCKRRKHANRKAASVSRAEVGPSLESVQV